MQPEAPSTIVVPSATAAVRRAAMDAAEREFTEPPGMQRVDPSILVGRRPVSETFREGPEACGRKP
ncbi:hypothetical protein GCM10022383_19540 [Microbacterium soli]|uniref:Uncharacterized protein n=1 Tax=Microbacterium soli TaxID=446075 RepID=A0ABP7NCS6_9MICO